MNPSAPWHAGGLGRAPPRRYPPSMTVLWTLLIVVGVAMIIVAVWPSIRPGRTGASAKKAPAPRQDPLGYRRPPPGGREP